MRFKLFSLIFISGLLLMSCSQQKEKEFEYVVDKFADLQVMRYQIPGFDELPLQKKKLAYYMAESGICGRDIIWDQKYKHGLCIRYTLENIYKTYSGERNTPEFNQFMVYLKRVWFSNGIFQHFSGLKFFPDFSKDYFAELIAKSDQAKFPLQKEETVEQLKEKLIPVLFDPNVDPIEVNTDPSVDMIAKSATNFYEGVTQKEVEAYYKKIADPNDKTPVSYGLNSKLIKENGKLIEKQWKVGGMYGPAIEKIVYWLEKAKEIAENKTQEKWLSLLIDYYKSGNLELFDEYNIVWSQDKESSVDAVNGYIETYGDPLGMRGSFEGIISFRDEEATKRIAAISNLAKWFEENSPIRDEHKKKEVKGISGKVITVVANTGDSYPSAPLGINLPNAEWIREQHGSKSVNLGNISYAYDKASETSGKIEEFFYTEEMIKRQHKYGSLADLLHTDMHEIIGHASGQLMPGVAPPNETLKGYSSALEESRADLVALYYVMDPKLVEIGLVPSLEVGKAGYDDYIINGLMVQLSRIELGDDIMQAHLRDRQLIARWAYEHGKKENVIEKKTRDGKTFFVINDYQKLRGLFGELLKEVQRLKSEGDYEAGKNLVESYGVKVEYDLHKEVLDRYAKLGIAPYGGFMIPKLVPVVEKGEITDVKVEYPKDFVKQNLRLSKEYGFLPIYN